MSGNIGTVLGFFKKMASTPLYYTVNKYVCCNEFRFGDLVGTDDKGNEYYENNDYFLGRLVGCRGCIMSAGLQVFVINIVYVYISLKL